MFEVTGTTKAWLMGSKVQIDNNVFKLHYRATAPLLVLFVLVIGTCKYFGDPIDCTTVEETKRLIDNYCWFNVYIIVPREPGMKYRGNYHPHRPIVDHSIKSLDQLKNHRYYKAHFLYAYQFIEFILFFQAMLFFIPRYLWRYVWEQGRIRSLSENLTRVTLKPLEDMEGLSDTVQFFKRTNYGNSEYAAKYIICEILNFANVLTQFLIINKTFSLDFNTLANDFLYSDTNSYLEHPVNLEFPNMARCEVPNPRGGGTALNQEYCVLPVNVFITKIYIFLWFYLFVLSIISGLGLVYRVLTICFPAPRHLVLRRLGGLLKQNDYENLMIHNNYGDWFVLVHLGVNIDPMSFKNLVVEYNKQMQTGRGSIPDASLVRQQINLNRPSLIDMQNMQMHNESLYNSDYLASALDRMKEMEMGKTVSTQL